VVKACILGEGRREQALAWTADKFGHEVYVVPGNAGIPWLRPGRAVPALRWDGVAFISAGILLVSRTPHGG
jgi:phosphoribosylamine-glycine ligase